MPPIGKFCMPDEPDAPWMLPIPFGKSPIGARIVTLYTDVVLRYVGSFEYDRAPRCCRGRRQVVTALFVRHDSSWFMNFPTFGYGVGVLKVVTTLTVPGSGHSL
jgi:hypothetical protein